MSILSRIFLKTPEQVACEQLLHAQRALLDAYCSLEAEQMRVATLEARVARLQAIQNERSEKSKNK